MGGEGYSFSMLQVFLVTKCIFVHFVRYFRTFCTILSRAKAVPLHRISKRAEIANKSLTKKSKLNLWNL